ncbi:hypothetical protein VSR68_15205 [Paraburkholderia phymatum]|uniref:hypothetical protein n=1 Tax=Paraburkholderia phymatum TaxID=148447 RepID=UPI00317792FE
MRRIVVDDGPRPTSQWLCHSCSKHAHKSAQQGCGRNSEIVDMHRMRAREAANERLSISVGVRMPDGGIGFSETKRRGLLRTRELMQCEKMGAQAIQPASTGDREEQAIEARSPWPRHVRAICTPCRRHA